MNLFAPTSLDFLPDWLRLALGIADILIRLAVLCWLPYNRKPVVALGWLMAIFFIPYVGFIAFLFFGSSRLPAYRRARQHAMNDIIREASENKPFLARTDDLSEPAKVALSLIHI